MTVVYVWVWFNGTTPQGEPIMQRVPASGPGAERPANVPEDAGLEQQSAEAWWDEIQESGTGLAALGFLANAIGDGRIPSWSVSARQMRHALNSYGLRDVVENFVSASGDRNLVDWWEYSMDYDRHHPMVVSLLPLLGVTPEAADSIWSLAEQL